MDACAIEMDFHKFGLSKIHGCVCYRDGLPQIWSSKSPIKIIQLAMCTSDSSILCNFSGGCSADIIYFSYVFLLFFPFSHLTNGK